MGRSDDGGRERGRRPKASQAGQVFRFPFDSRQPSTLAPKQLSSPCPVSPPSPHADSQKQLPSHSLPRPHQHQLSPLCPPSRPPPLPLRRRRPTPIRLASPLPNPPSRPRRTPELPSPLPLRTNERGRALPVRRRSLSLRRRPRC
jgi:hypothetical protein